MLKARLVLISLVCLITCIVSLLSCKRELDSLNDGSPISVVPPIVGVPIISDKSILNGYLDKQSYFPADSACLFVSSTVEFKNGSIGVYNALGTIVAYIKAGKMYHQEPLGDKPYENGFEYSDPIKFSIPELKSGVYLIANKIPFIIKSKVATDITIVYPSNTENAYCTSGRRSLYTTPVSKKVSFLRPIPYSTSSAGFLKWMLKQSYSYNVISDIDLEEYNELKGKLIIICGHNEYWTRKARRNFDKFVDQGNSALILSGNTMWWQITYNKEMNQVICYKYQGEPTTPDSLKTINWPDKRLKYETITSIGCDFNRGGYGNNGKEGWRGFKVNSPNSPLFAGLGVKRGDIINCPTAEYDGAPLKGFDKYGYPILDEKELGFEKVELLGFDLGFRVTKTVGTATLFMKKTNSGTIVNFPSTDWCTVSNFGNPQIPQITKNAIDGLLAKRNLFSN